MDYSQTMPLIERALKADPKFLPGHYALAMMQPTAEKRIAELEKVAQLDPDNAQPYFLMAIETWNQIVAGKKFATGSNDTAFDISLADWERVSALLEKVNASKTFTWRACPLPSVKDITVSTNCKAWPVKAVGSRLTLNADVNLSKLGGGQYAPDVSIVSATNGIVRQFARQAAWAAKAAYKEKNTDQALHFLDTIREFSGKYSAHEPYALMPFLVGNAVRGIAAEAETKLLQDIGGQDDRLKAVKDETARWKEALGLCEDVTRKGLITADSVLLSPAEKLQYNDIEAERAGVKTILTKAGIIR